jgi:hypothetical protein
MAFNTPSAIGSMTAVAAVLLIHIDMLATAMLNAIMIRIGLLPTHSRERSQLPKRRSRPCTIKASEIKKLPINKKMIGCEKAAKTDFIPPTPVNTHKPQPNRAVMGRGMGSVIHITTTHVKIAANVRAESERVSGRNTNISPAISGATNKPKRCGEVFAEVWREKELIE